MKKLLIFSGLCACILASTASFAQIIRGKILNSSNEPLPFATIYVKGTTNGTVSNIEGGYELRVPSKRITVVAQYTGYKKYEKTLSLNASQVFNFNFKLKEEALQLKAVIVTNDDEDPAYAVIREAIKKRSFYEKEVKAYQANIYMKSLQRIDKKPDKILGVKVEIDTGIVYLSESISELKYEYPDKTYEKIISSKMSGNNQAYSYNQASDMLINVYEKSAEIEGLSERNFVSPISPQAFLFYRYKLIGIFEENGEIVNKIKLLPKRKNDPVYDGEIYITENSWRIHTINFLLKKERGLEFVDSLKINQVFAKSDYDTWMPISQRFSYQFGAFGFKGSGYDNLVISDYQIEPNYELFKKNNLYTKYFKDSAQVDLFTKNDFRKEVLRIDENSNKKDSLYWKKIRPIPLTLTERIDYHQKDSLQKIKESKTYKDSVDRESNRFTLGKMLLTGFQYKNTYNRNLWNFPPIISTFQYNTIEGFVTELQPTYSRLSKKNKTKYSISPTLRYGFGNKKWSWKVEGDKPFGDEKSTLVAGGFGNYVTQINDAAPYFNESISIRPIINTIYTLFNGNNYMKLYRKKFIYGLFQQELFNGVTFTGKLEYANRLFLKNRQNQTVFIEENKRRITRNLPSNPEIDNEALTTNKALVSTVGFQIRFAQKYAIRPEGKIIMPSKYPEISVIYKKGWETSLTNTNYDFINVIVSDNMRFGLWGSSSYQLKFGKFLNTKKVSFIDFEHFHTNQTIINLPGNTSNFQLLPYYEYSTKRMYFAGHYEHHFNGFIINKLPLIRKTKVQAVASANYLNHKGIGNYWEFGFGIEHIFKLGRIDFWTAYKNGKYNGYGIRLGFGF